MVYVLLAPGFEEIEALAPVDILRRADVLVKTVGIEGKTVLSAHGVPVVADLSEEEALAGDFEMLFLPGGGLGTANLDISPTAAALMDRAVQTDAYLAAICAAPSILGKRGLLKGKKAVCFPGFEEELKGAVIATEPVVQDGKVITGKGPGLSILFGLHLVSVLKGEEVSKKIAREMQCADLI